MTYRVGVYCRAQNQCTQLTDRTARPANQTAQLADHWPVRLGGFRIAVVRASHQSVMLRLRLRLRLWLWLWWTWVRPWPRVRGAQ